MHSNFFRCLTPALAVEMKKKKKKKKITELWPANKSDRSWQSLSNPAKRHSFVSN